jgi:hypothetical protein
VDTTWKTMVWRQFGAAIQMLENALLACPDALWSDDSRPPPVWYSVFHALFYLDLYLSDGVEGFTPPAPFTLGELETDVLPDASTRRTSCTPTSSMAARSAARRSRR